MRVLSGLIGGCVWLAVPLGCSSSSAKNDASAGGSAGTSADASTGGSGAASAGGTSNADAAPAPPPVRSACGNVAIPSADYAPGTLPAACKTCVDTQCCDQANACAGDPACMKFRECRAVCRSGANCVCGVAPKTSGDLQKCASTCDACLDLSCVGKPWPVPPPGNFEAFFNVQNFLTGAPEAGVRVRACAMADTACTSPLAEASVDAQGAVSIELPSGPGGTVAYLEITGGDVEPTLFFFHLFDGEFWLKSGLRNFGLLDAGTAHALWGGVGSTADPAVRGLISVQVTTCGGTGASGATVTATGTDAVTISSYFEGGLPTAAATVTDTSGVIDFIGVAPGPSTVTVMKDGKQYATRDIFVRAGFNSAVFLPPEQ